MSGAAEALSADLVERFELEALPHQAALYRSAFRLTKNPHDAEDLVQDTMVRACAGFRQFSPGTNAKAWLHRIMTNAFINGYRKRHREPVLTVSTVDPAQVVLAGSGLPADCQSAEDQVLARLPAADILAALRDLHPDFRMTVYLIDVEGFSYRQAAEIMGTPIGTVMSRLHRARMTLRAALAPTAPIGNQTAKLLFENR
jgi:RNA polymerase sigma-70 factor, ECF subfamily